MNKDARLSKDKISSMYSHVVDIHNYEALGITYGGQKTNIGDALDQIINAVMFFSTSAEKPAFSRLYQMEYKQPEAAKILSELNGLQQRMFRIHKGTEVPDDLPAVSDAKHIFARAYSVFNSADSYVSFVQSVLQHAADDLGLGLLLQVDTQQGMSM
jgi:hypothetical protein